MKHLRLGCTFAIAASLVGCNSFNNHSLDYKNTTTLASLKLPTDTTMRAPTPLYPAPVVEQLAIDHAPKLENSRGNRFALPRPVAATAAPTTVASANQAATTEQLGKAQVILDGNKNPLLQVSGTSAEIWRYSIAILSSLNYQISGQDNPGYQANITIDNQVYVLKLTGVGSTHYLALFMPDNNFAKASTASDVLNKIVQNWPIQ